MPRRPNVPSSIRKFWQRLESQVSWLHGRWMIYRQMFGTSQKQFDIMHEVAPTFFYIFQRVLLADIQLSISKIGDSAESRGDENMTLKGLSKRLSKIGELKAASKLDSKIKLFSKSCKKIRHRRNKILAHFDSASMMRPTSKSIKWPSRAEIEKALRALREAMNTVNSFYKMPEKLYEHLGMNDNATHVIEALRRGIRYRRLVADGTISYDDLDQNFPME